MVVLTEWLATLVRPLLGEEVEIIGPIGIGRAASAGGVVVAHVLAMLMTLDLLVVVPIHAVVLVADSRSRRRYHAHVSSVGLGVAVFWLLAAPW
jgi:hypothetical protein